MTDEKKVRSCIYSIHIHPHGKKIATGGLGVLSTLSLSVNVTDVDTKIRIWNVEPVLDAAKEMDPNTPRLLSTLGLHNGAVLCVRFSQLEGRYLASGSDGENVILIWEQDQSTDAYRGKVFGSDETNVESWRSVKRLIGHQSDVVDIQWNHDNSLLASCGLDCSIIIWDAENNFELLRKLEGHHGFVKGLAWDPAGKFLASQADDRSVMIWNTSEWTTSKQLFSTFEKSIGQTFFKRLSWSPEGSQICAVHAVDQSQIVSTASIINRDKWSEDICLVGHLGIIECASYNPHVFSKNKQAPFCVCVLGGQDGTLSFWTSNKARAPLAIEALFDGTIFDVCWSPDGQSVFACSADGSVAVVKFDSNSFGKPISSSQTESMMSKYGFKRNKEKELPETVHQLLAEDESFRAQQQRKVAFAPDTTAAPPILQAEDGRLSMLMGESSQHRLGGETVSGFGAFSNSTSAPQQVPSTPTPSLKLSIEPNASQLSAQKTSITKDGKWRIQPIFLQASSSVDSGTSSSASKKPVQVNDLYREEIEIKRRFMQLISSKETERLDQRTVKLPVPKLRSHFQLTLDADRTILVENDLTGGASLAKTNKIRCSISQVESWVEYFAKPILDVCIIGPVVVACCSDTYLHFVSTKSGRRRYPRLKLDGRMVFMKGNSTCQQLAILTEHGRLWMWKILDNQLDCMIKGVSTAPLVFEVDQPDAKAKTTEEQESDCVMKRILVVDLTDQGLILLGRSDQFTFTYNIMSEAWVQIRSSDVFECLSSQFNYENYVTNKRHKNEKSDIVGVVGGVGVHGWWDSYKIMQYLSTDPTKKDLTGRMALSYLEDLLAVAVCLKDADLYRRILRVYCVRLCDAGDVSKAEEFCSSLNGPASGEIWEPLILDVPKSELLKDVLQILVQNRRFQRVVESYRNTEHNSPHFMDLIGSI